MPSGRVRPAPRRRGLRRARPGTRSARRRRGGTRAPGAARAGVGQGQPCRVPADPLQVDLPEEAVALLRLAGTAKAPFLLPLALDLAEQAILVPGLKELFRTEEIHNLALL